MDDGYTASSAMISAEYRRRAIEPLADIRALIAWIYIVLATTVLGSIGIISLIFDRKAVFLHWIVELWGRGILKVCGVRAVVEGAEYADLSEPKVIMANHQSQVDIWMIVAHLPRKLRFVAKAELRRVPIVGTALARGGHVLIERKGLKRAFASYDRAAEQIREGTSIVVFAEGTRSADGRLLPFKKGGFMLALKAGVPIVPVTIDGSAGVLPKGTWRIRPGTVRMVFHKPVDSSLYTIETKSDLMNTVREAIASGFAGETTMSSRRQ
jgi:1-acyl-sn-glycerol-3-phosphate acyltransferase